VYDEGGAAVGVSSAGETARCKFVVGDASYFPGKTRVSSRVVRAVCIMSHPVPNTNNAHSAQIILPQKQTGRQSGAVGGAAARRGRGRGRAKPTRHAARAASLLFLPLPYKKQPRQPGRNRHRHRNRPPSPPPKPPKP
jgi:hypothetical protein